MMTSISTKQFTEVEFKCWLITISEMAEGDRFKNVLRYFIMSLYRRYRTYLYFKLSIILNI